MNLFVNGATTPTLAIGSLAGDTQEGNLRWSVQARSPISRSRQTPSRDSPQTPNRTRRPATSISSGHWQLAPFSELPDGKEPTIADLPKPSAEWRGLAAERGGLVNVTRVYGLPVKRPVRSLTWLKTTISSKKSQSKKVAIGWTREIWLFVNGQRCSRTRTCISRRRRESRRMAACRWKTDRLSCR